MMIEPKFTKDQTEAGVSDAMNTLTRRFRESGYDVTARVPQSSSCFFELTVSASFDAKVTLDAEWDLAMDSQEAALFLAFRISTPSLCGGDDEAFVVADILQQMRPVVQMLKVKYAGHHIQASKKD